MAAAASSSAAAADLPQPQVVASSHERYKKGTRVWMVTDGREKGKQEWVKAVVYRTEEETSGATAVSMREVAGREEFRVVVPHQAKTSPHRQQAPVEQPVDQDDGSTKVASHQPRLFQLPQEVERDILWPLLGNDLAVSLAHTRGTCRPGRDRVSADLLESLIHTQLTSKGLKDIITFQLASMDFLQRLLYALQNSGKWAAMVPIIRVAKHQGRGGGRQLPIELTSGDVEAVGSRAVYDGRCEALRQLSLIGRHLGRMALKRDDNGRERLGGHLLTLRPLQTPQSIWDTPGSILVHLPGYMDLRDRLRSDPDPNNPVCVRRGTVYASVRDSVLQKMRSGGSEVAVQHADQHSNARRYDLLESLATQPPPVWNCHTISTSCATNGTSRRIIVLHGDQQGHQFQAHLYIICRPPSIGRPREAEVYLYTTEPPVAGTMGTARFPQTVRVVWRVLGADRQRVFGHQLDGRPWASDKSVQTSPPPPPPTHEEGVMAVSTTDVGGE
ncbi:unnamed protein product [Vitrella brassicaformis CCMP3155]|uniref:Uncharacterized protein n=1 Tax=Vitrella brassicaformis (strain CCMP3155) TaxID=1169540 RepID=A0A0G4GGS1_VITBC|nr:unnamed protein product [Vitrella brassicaformis CCMP3155]|eukprot:CEM28646.1 unnamed protein product [Vitrella brassicaformis CCMP3155]